MAQNRNLFRLTRFILLKLPMVLGVFAKFRKPEKRVLIIKADAIGDYFLFRNFIEVAARSSRFENHQIDMLGNTLWKDIALNYDAAFIDKAFFTSPDALYHSPVKVIELGWQLFRRNYEVVLQPTYARTFIADGLAGLASARYTIGFEGDTERIAPKYKAKTDRFYTELLPLPAGALFEFHRSAYFIKTVLNGPVLLNGPSIETGKGKKKGIVIFPGAGVLKRGWEQEKFLALITRINEYTYQPIYLAGGPGETAIGNYLTQNLPPNAVGNLIGKTTLPQLVQLIGDAVLVIANETSAIHIAAATKTRSVCILGGGHFGRFAPYPDQMPNKPACVYEKMECFNCNWNCIFPTAENEPYPCISAISFEKVWQETLSALQQI